MTQQSHLYTCGLETPSFRWDPDAPEHLYCETLDPLEKTLAFLSTPLYGRRKEVAQWNFLLGCLRVGHRYMENTKYIVTLAKIPLRLPDVRVSNDSSCYFTWVVGYRYCVGNYTSNIYTNYTYFIMLYSEINRPTYFRNYIGK